MTPEAPRPAPPQFGDPAPRFTAATDGIANYSIEVAAGRWMVLFAFGTLGHETCRDAHAAVLARRALFNDTDAVFYGVSVDPKDRVERGLANLAPGVRYFWDFDRAVSTSIGVVSDGFLKPWILVIDRGFRVVFSGPVEETAEALVRLEEGLLSEAREETPTAPVLLLPRILEPEFCEELLACFRAGAPVQSGFSAEVGGRTVQLLNPALKRRQDVLIADGRLKEELCERLRRRLFPQIEAAFAWRPEFIERFLIARYDEADHGFFSAHRDNVTSGTAHRKFAVTINLNTEAYAGGELRFPEFGPRLYRAPTGGAVVFSCGLLHEALPVVRGTRYAFVPFLYDKDGARVRSENLGKVSFGAGATDAA